MIYPREELHGEINKGENGYAGRNFTCCLIFIKYGYLLQAYRKAAHQIEALLEQMTLEEKVSLCHANSKFSVAPIGRLAINELTMSDGPPC